MAVGYNPRAVPDGLVLALDAGNPKNYNAGISTNWTDKVGGNNGTLVGGTYHNDGPFVGAGYVEFDGTGDYLSIADSADFDLGSGDFTIEGWFYIKSGNSTGAGWVSQWNSGFAWYFGTTSVSVANKFVFGYSTDGSGITIINSGYLVTNSLNQWVHYAVSKSGTDVRLFVNGTQQGPTGTLSGTIYNSSDDIVIGLNEGAGSAWYFNGNMSNVRVIKGTALYTSNFTPPTKQLTAITNTTLLTCQGNTIADASSSAHTITANGDISLTKEPFGGAGAVSFDGTGDYLSPDLLVSSTVFAYGTGDFTWEMWVYVESFSNNRYVLDHGSNGGTIGNGGSSQTTLKYYNTTIGTGSVLYTTGFGTLSTSTWYHLAAVRENGTTSLYTNGALTTSAGDSHNYGIQGLNIGRYGGGGYEFDGYISNLRIIKGTALYTSNFTPPAEPLTAVTNTELLTCQGQNIKDASSNAHTITVNGDAKATIVSSSFEFDGTDDYVTISDDDSLTSTTSLTINCWVRATTFNSPWSAIVGKGTADTNEEYAVVFHSSFLYFDVGSGGPYTQPSYTFNTNTWYNICCTHTRTSGSSSLLCYVNGVFLNNSTASPTNAVNDNSFPVSIGSRYHNSITGPLNGNIAQVSIYNRALTAAEVEQNYNATKGRYA